VKVLSYGDNPKSSTGYGQVWDNLLPRFVKLKPDWEFYHCGWQSQDRPHKRPQGYTILPTGKFEYAVDTMYRNLMEHKPDILVTLCDVGLHAGYVKQVNLARMAGWKGEWIAYSPLDTHGWSPSWNEILSFPDINVAMSKFGEKEFKRHFVKNVVYIPHGVDLETYKPRSNKEELKIKYKLQKQFVIGFVGRNQLRKMIDRLIMGFARFSQGKNDVKLLMHTDDHPVKIGWEMPILRGMFKIHDKSLITRKDLDIVERQKIGPKQMNEIYNLMDIFGYATGGEGFGLPAVECQAAGVPLLMTNCTTAFDLCKEKNRIPILKDVHGRDCKFIGANGVFFKYPDDIKMAEMFEEKYKEWKAGNLKKESEHARNFAEGYDWQPIAERWIKLFENGK